MPGVLTRLLRPPEQRATLKNPDQALIDALRGGLGTSAGVVVSEEGALAYGAVLACVRVLSEAVASLPCIMYERVKLDGQDGKQRATSHPLYRVLHNKPNPEMSAFEMGEMMLIHLLLWGNFYAEIVVDGSGNVAQLWPIPPRLVTPTRLQDKRLVYDINVPEKPRTFGAEWIFHVPAMRMTGLKGLSVVGLAREGIGLGIAAERFGSAVFGNGTVPGAVLEHPGVLSDKAYDRLRSKWAERHQGLDNAQRLAVLEEGMKYTKIGIPPEDAQFLETRKFQRSEIAGMFRVPPHMIADLDKATFSNIEHQAIEYVVHTLRPWLKRIESRINGWLLLEAEQTTYFAEYLVEDLLKGDTPTRYQAFSTARQWGWMSVNEIRARENMNPIPDGDVYLQPMNMVQAGQPLLRAAPTSPGDEAPRIYRQERRSETDIEKTGRGRQQMAASYRRTIEEAARRLVNREVNDVRNAARKRLGQRSVADFESWLNDFYADFGHVAREYLMPTMQTLGELTRDDVEREIDQRWPDDELETWVYNYVDGRAMAWCGNHRRRLLEALRAERSVTTRTSEDDVLADIEAILDEMQERDPERFAREQAVREINAIATTIYSYFVLAMRWFTFGESCEWCSQLAGQVIASSGWFLQDGGSLLDAAGTVFRVSGNVRHAPLHEGCDCQVLAA